MSHGTHERKPMEAGGRGSGISKSWRVDQLREDLPGRGTGLHEGSEAECMPSFNV